eukprot:1161622-Pelagomonas_calceolata.AAC.15
MMMHAAWLRLIILPSVCVKHPPSSDTLVVHFSTMMMHTAWLRLDISFNLVAPVARCKRAAQMCAQVRMCALTDCALLAATLHK